MMLLTTLALSSTALAEDSKHGEGGCDGCKMKGLGASIDPVAMAQVWVTAYDMDTDAQADATGYGDPEDDPGVKLKRLRLGLTGETHKWNYRLVIGTAAPYDGLERGEEDLGVVDAWIGVQPAKGLDIRVGQDKVPFSRDQLMGAGELVFTERGIGSEHIAPDRSLGLSLAYGMGGGKLTAGAYNAGGDLFGDEANGKTVAGRLEWDIGKANTYQTWGDKDAFGIGIGGNGFYTMGVATDTWAAGGDIMVRAKGLSLLVDGAVSHITPTNTDIDSSEVFAETDRMGLTAQLSYQVRAFEPAVRYSMFNDSTLGDYKQVLIGGEWHTAEDHVRIGAGYQLRLEEPAVDNDTARLWAQFRL